MTNRKFYKTVIKVTVLSEKPIPDTMSMEEIAREAIEGDYSFDYERTVEKVLNGKQAAKELVKQASSPEFFNITNKGEDWNHGT